MGKPEHAEKKLQSRGLATVRRLLSAGVSDETGRRTVIAA